MKTNKIITLLFAALMSMTLILSWAFAEDGDGTKFSMPSDFTKVKTGKTR